MNQENLLQSKDSQLCSAYASKFALQKVGINYSLSKIISQLPISDTYGIGLYDLTLFFTQFPLEIQINSYGTYLKESTPYKDIFDLLKKSVDLRPWQQSLKKCLSKNISFQTNRLSLQDFVTHSKNGWTCIAYVNSSILYQNSDQFFGHYVYIDSISSDQVILQDSHWGFGGLKAYPTKKFIESVHSGDDHVLWIKKP